MVSKSMNSGEMVITGTGVISPFGLGLEPFSKGLKNGSTAVGPVTRFALQDWCQARLCATVPDFPLEGGNSVLEQLTGNSKESNRASPQLRLAWASVHQALQNAGLVIDETNGQRTGIFVGSSRFSMDRVEFIMEKSSSGRLAEVLPLRTEWVHPHGTTAHLSYLYKITGPTLTFAASCQSGIQALEAAMLYLQNDHIDIALVVTADTLSRFQLHVEAAANFLSPQQNPDRAPRPYDQKADGAVLSEGGATLIVEKGSLARSRGAQVRARIISLATVSLPTRFYPVSDFSKNMEMALARLFSSTDTQALDLICGDGRGIPGMDRAEAIGIRRTLGKLSDKVPITSIQGSLGHAGGTSAMFQIIATALAFDSSLIPPIRNLEKPAPGCDLNFVFGKARKSRVNQALVLSHGWGGQYSALVLQKGN